MNYKLHYDKLIHRAQNRSILKSEYKEVHHIIPTCIGGKDTKENKIPLLPEEHIIAHLLLTKIYPNNYSLLKAANGMTNGYNNCIKYTNKQYAWLKQKYAKRLSAEILADPIHLRDGVLEKMSSRMKGDKNPMKNVVNKLKQSKRMKGDNNPMKNTATINKMKDSQKKYYKENEGPNKGKHFSDETKLKQSLSAKNRKSINRKKLYHLISPKNNIIICDGNLGTKIREYNLSGSILKRLIGTVISPESREYYNTVLRNNTTGWMLKEIT